MCWGKSLWRNMSLVIHVTKCQQNLCMMHAWFIEVVSPFNKNGQILLSINSSPILLLDLAWDRLSVCSNPLKTHTESLSQAILDFWFRNSEREQQWIEVNLCLTVGVIIHLWISTCIWAKWSLDSTHSSLSPSLDSLSFSSRSSTLFICSTLSSNSFRCFCVLWSCSYKLSNS